MTRTGKVNKLNQHIAEPFLEMHPEDAAIRDLSEGILVEIKNTRGSVKVKLKLTTDIKKVSFFCPCTGGKTAIWTPCAPIILHIIWLTHARKSLI
ncbi:MAG: hypothetical protein HC817_00800 [Saprospiraceae bacterium]|nr:hypothetical protein [Saprospiraceae bacterium]